MHLPFRARNINNNIINTSKYNENQIYALSNLCKALVVSSLVLSGADCHASCFKHPNSHCHPHKLPRREYRRGFNDIYKKKNWLISKTKTNWDQSDSQNYLQYNYLFIAQSTNDASHSFAWVNWQ